ncbi:MAG: dephospho-CoA kinase [Opitutales bacterium]|nr:dephospho-CoA kinase [Opitutales bacterium]
MDFALPGVRRIGLTGGIGCGKSTALAYFGDCGATTFEADAEVRRLLREDAGVREAVVAAFGEPVRAPDGAIDRAALAHIVFHSASQLARLEAILHPRVRKAWQDLLESPKGWVVVEIPLLFENDLQSLFDCTICLFVGQKTQTTRLRDRGLSLSQIELRRSRQWPLARKMESADTVFVNEGSTDHLRSQVEDFLKLSL